MRQKLAATTAGMPVPAVMTCFPALTAYATDLLKHCVISTTTATVISQTHCRGSRIRLSELHQLANLRVHCLLLIFPPEDAQYRALATGTWHPLQMIAIVSTATKTRTSFTDHAQPSAASTHTKPVA